MDSEVVVECRTEGVAEPLSVLDHFVERLVTLFDKGIVLFNLLVFGFHVKRNALLFTLQLHDLLLHLAHLHTLLHHV